jgi:DNA-binding IclR family transcriptional regulator
MSMVNVLPNVEEPAPITPVRVKKVVSEKRVIKFDATQPALREIRRRGYGILAERKESGFCVLVVNQCYDFSAVLAWMLQLQNPEMPEGEE